MNKYPYGFFTGRLVNEEGSVINMASRFDEDNTGIVENGKGFSAYHIYNIGTGETRNLQFKTSPNKKTIMIIRLVDTDIDELQMKLLRNATVTDGTNTIPIRCMNCVNPETPETTITSNPTVSGGTIIDLDIIFTTGIAQKTSGISTLPDIRRILAPNENYIIQLSDGTNTGKALIKLIWAEI